MNLPHALRARLPFLSFRLGFAAGWYPLPKLGAAYVWNRPTGCRSAFLTFGRQLHWFAARGQRLTRLVPR